MEYFLVGEPGLVYQGDADAGREGRLLHRVQVVGGGYEALGEGVEGWFGDVIVKAELPANQLVLQVYQP